MYLTNGMDKHIRTFEWFWHGQTTMATIFFSTALFYERTSDDMIVILLHELSCYCKNGHIIISVRKVSDFLKII